jgi:hypothetical protein
MLAAYRLEVTDQPGLGGRRQHGDAILGALAAANDDLIRREVAHVGRMALAVEEDVGFP